MRQRVAAVVSVLLIGLGFVSASTLAVPLIIQCEVPMQSIGSVGIRVPLSPPKSGEFLIKFQRLTGEPTQVSINFSEIKEIKSFIDRIVKTINEESAQRAPKMAAVPERGLDQTTFSSGPIQGLALTEIFRFLLIYDPQEMLVSFQNASNYVPLCLQLAPIREIPNLTEIKVESRPKLLFVGFPERITSGQPTQGAVAFADLDDDVASLRFDYRSEDGSQSDTYILDLVVPIGGGIFGPGLKSVRFSLTVDCRRGETKFLATVIARDKKNQQSEPLSFDFICER